MTGGRPTGDRSSLAASAVGAQAKLREKTGGEGRPPRVFADFHVHMRFSRDSVLTEERLIRAAMERGLTHIAVTNHNNVEGAIAVRDAAREMGVDDRLTVILGEEVSTADGEVVGIFLQRTIPRGLSAEETADEIHAQGGLVSIPHPFDPFRCSHIREVPLTRAGGGGQDRRRGDLQQPRHVPAPQPAGRRVRRALRAARHRRAAIRTRRSRSR